MRRFDVSRALNSPLTLVALLVLTATCTFGWLRAARTSNAPNIPGVEWEKHPNAILVAYPNNDCGCGLTPLQWVTTGIAHKLHVVLIAAKPLKVFKDVERAQFPAGVVTVVSNADPKTVKYFTYEGDKAGAARVRNGVMIYQVHGGTPSDAFFN